MKKVLMVLAVLALSFSLVACNNGKNNDVNQGNNNSQIENNVPGEDVEQGENNLPNEGLDENGMPAVSEEMESLVNDLVTTVGEGNMFVGMATRLTGIEAPADLGITEEEFNAKIADAVKYDPMMMPTKHSLCIVKVKDGEDVAAVKEEIFNNADYRKWICTAAEHVLVADSGNYVMLVMSTPEICDNLFAALQIKFGTENVGTALRRDGEPAVNYNEAM